jgi:hypothetical protein
MPTVPGAVSCAVHGRALVALLSCPLAVCLATGVGCAVSVSDPFPVLPADPTTSPPEATEPPPAATASGAPDAGPLVADGGRSDAARQQPADGGGNQPPAAPKPAAGEVLVTEVMYNPSGTEPDAEWIEVYNAASGPRTLTGLVLRDGGGRTHTIGGSVVLAAGRYAVLARSTAAATAAKVPASAIVYEYGAGQQPQAGILLANGATGAIALLNGSATIATATYGSFFGSQAVTGRSVQLKVLTASAATNAASWCLSSTVWATGADRGTPGAGSDCP